MSQSGKYIILIEPGTPKSYERMMKDREYLLSKGLRLVLPCPHEQKCSLRTEQRFLSRKETQVIAKLEQEHSCVQKFKPSVY